MATNAARATTPFGVFLEERQVAIKDLPLPLRNMARRLKTNRTIVAPNSPLLPKLAEHLNAPLAQIASFAEGDPMPEKWVKKIQTQIDRGTIPRGKQLNRWNKKKAAAAAVEKELEKPAKQKANYIKTPFAKLADSKGFTTRELAERLNVPQAYMWRVSCGVVAKNHPVLDVLATILKVEVSQLARLMKLKPLSQAFRERARKDLESRLTTAPGTAVVKVETNGHAVEPRTQNRLGSKRTQLALRNAARTMVATLNVAIMRGHTHMPAIPVGDLYLLLQDYLQEKGVKQTVLVDLAFPRIFDPKE